MGRELVKCKMHPLPFGRDLRRGVTTREEGQNVRKTDAAPVIS
jgi:hypothetical protein